MEMDLIIIIESSILHKLEDMYSSSEVDQVGRHVEVSIIPGDSKKYSRLDNIVLHTLLTCSFKRLRSLAFS